MSVVPPGLSSRSLHDFDFLFGQNEESVNQPVKLRVAGDEILLTWELRITRGTELNRIELYRAVISATGCVMRPTKVLFICVHNGARSQMAEAYLIHFGEGLFQVESAGLEPGVLNPRVVQVLQEDGIDISRNKTKSVFDMFKQGKSYDFVITVCDETSAEKCPVFPGDAKRLHWSFPDPSALPGTEEARLEGTRAIRDVIKAKVKQWIYEDNH